MCLPSYFGAWYMHPTLKLPKHIIHPPNPWMRQIMCWTVYCVACFSPFISFSDFKSLSFWLTDCLSESSEKFFCLTHGLFVHSFTFLHMFLHLLNFSLSFLENKSCEITFFLFLWILCCYLHQSLFGFSM